MSNGCLTISAVRTGDIRISASIICPVAETTRRYRTSDGYLYKLSSGGYYILLEEEQ